MRLRAAAAFFAAQSLCATLVLGGDITSGTLQIQGVSLEVDTPAVTTGIDIPTTIQTKFGGKTNEAAPLVEGLVAVGDLTGPGLDNPLRLTTAPGYRFQIPGFSREGVYYLQNVRLMKGNDFVAPAVPSAAAITVANVLQTSVKVRQLTPDELRSRGIVVDGRNYNVYEYSFTFLVDGKTVEIPFPVIVDPRTHEVTPIAKETPFNLPPTNGTSPPRWSPPDVVTFELPPDEDAAAEQKPDATPGEHQVATKRPSIPAAIVIPNSLAVLHQFFAVILTVSNGAPSGSTATLDDIRATIKVPAALRTAKTNPTVAFGQPVPIVDPTNNVTFLVAQAKGEAEWDLEGLQPGTHTVEIEVRATFRERGQQDVPLKATPRASIVVQDPRFNITFSHPDTVRKGIDYSTFTFITNMSGATQTMRVSNGVPSCDAAAGANVCRLSGAESDDITLAAGEMKMVEYKLRPGVTGHVFATAGTVDGDAIAAAVQLHMGVSETGIPLSPTTLVMPYYAQFLTPDLIDANLQLLGLGYSIATAPVNQMTAKLPRVIRSDVFYRAGEIARAGQRIFISDTNADAKRDALIHLALDMLGNGVELDEWDALRRQEKSGRIAGAAIIKELAATNRTATIGEFVDKIAAATSYRAPYVLAIAQNNAAIALRGASGRRAAIANEATSGWIRDLAFADISQFGANAQIAIAGRWTEDVEIDVTPATTGVVPLDVIYPGATDGTAMRAHFDLNGTAGEVLRVPLTRGAPASATLVTPVALQAVAARQDLNLDPEGHKVSVLFNRPVALQPSGDWRAHFSAQIAFNRDGVVYNGDRSIFAAALQQDSRVVNLSFDSVLTTNANYTIALQPLVDPVTNANVAFAQPLIPKIDNVRPAGIISGKFLKGDNTPIGGAEVRLYTGHFRGCQVGIMDDEPPVDCNPYVEAPQYEKTQADGSYLFEYIPRDPIGDEALSGGYRLLGVNTGGRFTIVDGSVRLPGHVHFVNLQLLGRGAAEGIVRYDNGQVVAGANVFVGSTMFNIGRSAKTDANGFFHVDDLPVGPITFTAKDVDGNITYASGEIATPGQLISKALQIIRKTNPGTATVFGVVLRSDTHAPVVAARVGVYSQGYAVSDTLTDANGRFEFTKVPAGFVTVLAAEWSVSRQSAAIDFDLHPDETHEVNLTLSVVAPNDATATLSGDIIRENPLFPGDPAKYEHVAGAVVKFAGRAITSDASGHFTYDSIPTAWNTLGLTITAYDPSTKRVGSVPAPTLTEAGPNNVSIFIAANSFGTGTLRVKLLSATGQPVTGFRVIEPGFPPTPFTSLGAGLYQLTPPVGAPIEIWAVNGPPEFGDQFAHDSARLEFPGQIATVTMRLPGQGTVRVKLHGDFDVIGDVTLGYRVWDESEQMPQPKFPARTTSTSENGIAGYATFTKVPALQAYTVESNHPSYGYASATGTLAYDGDLGTHVLQLRKLSTIRGTVYAIDGKTPIAGAAVRLNDGTRDTGVTLTQPDGTFVYTDVPSDIHFSIVAEATQSGIYRTGVAYGITPSLGGPVAGVAVVLKRRGSVEGRVVYIGYKRFDPSNPANNIVDDTPNDLSDNAPVPLAKFWLKELDFPQRSFGSDAEPLSADVAGRFALSSVFVGSLRARAWDSRNQDLRGDWTGTIDEEGQPVTAYIGIGVGGTGSVQVTIVDPNQSNAPVANAEVGLYRGGLFDLASSDANGVAAFQQVPVATYSISVYSKALGKSGSSAAFTVEKDLVAQQRVLLEFSGKVDGTLTDPEATAPNAVSGAPVTLTGSGYQTRATTNTLGAFTFDGVREGLFTLTARDTQSNRRATASHTLSAADPHPVVNLELEHTATLYVNVYTPDDTGASSGTLAGPVSIDIVQRGGDFLRSMQGNPIVMPKLFASDPYEITVHEIGGEQRTLAFKGQFPKGSATDPVSLVYPTFGSVDVTVTQSGAPANNAKVVVAGGGRSVTLFTDASGRVTATGIALGSVSAQSTSVDGAFSGSASGQLLRTSVHAALSIDLGAYAGVTGLVEAERGGPSIGTRVLAAFAGRTLEIATDAAGRYTFNGIPTASGGTVATLTYIGTDDVTIGGRQSVTIGNAAASKVITLPTIKLDATPPQVVSISPLDGAQSVSPDSKVKVTFSEPIRADQINNSFLQLVPADGTGQVTAIFDPPVTSADGTFVVTMRPPPPAAGQRFPLKSNTLYRVIISGAIEDLTGHRLPSPLGTTFTTSDYTEPHVIKTVPAVTSPVPEQITFQFVFNEPVDPAPWQAGGGASFHLYKLSAPGAGGQIIAEKAGRAYIDPATSLILYFAPNDPIESESFYRVVFTGIRDMQGNALAEQTFHFFSFDKTKPFVRLISPVPAGFPLISGVEYTLGVDLRNGTADGTPATDVATVDYSRVDGTAETYLTTLRATPFAYRFVAPDTPEAGLTYSLRAKATDGSGNVGDPATITWTVKPNAPPKNVAITFTPASAYPSNNVTANVTFDDEGTFATVVVALNAMRQDGSTYSTTQTKQVTRATVADPWPAAQIAFALPANLKPAEPATFSATVTDVRGLFTTTVATLPLLTDATKPLIGTTTPLAETNFRLGDHFVIEATATDAETGVAEVDFNLDGHSYAVTTATNNKFTSPQITVPAKNINTRITVTVSAKDFQGNIATKSFEIVYIGVNDPAAPKGTWLCPVDRGVIPAAQTSFTLPLRVHATDDIAVTSVKFRVPGIADIDAARVGTTDDYAAIATLPATPNAGADFTLTAVVSDADASHTIEVPIAVDVVAVDKVIDSTQSIDTNNLADFANKSVLVHSASGRLVLHAPVTLRNLIVLDGARVDTIGTTTSLEQSVDLTIVDRLYVDCASSIDVSGKGYLGGWGANPDGTNTRNESQRGRTIGNNATAGALNAGATHGGLAAQSDNGGTTNATYDAITGPAQLGSGGSGSIDSSPGGTGGGAISIRTSDATDAIARVAIAGSLRADGNGAGGAVGAGSGGSIRVSSRQLIVGASAHLTVNGGDAGFGGGGGRIAVISSERLDVPNVLTQFESRGGETFSTTRLGAAAGTIYVRRPGQTYGELYSGNASASRAVRSTPIGQSGDATVLHFDRVEAGTSSLVRFDQGIDPSTPLVKGTGAAIVLVTDTPSIAATTTPAAGATLIRGTNVDVTYDAASVAGLVTTSVNLSAVAPLADNLTSVPPSVGARHVLVAVTPAATLGAATLNVHVVDRADRIADAPVLNFDVIDNSAPKIETFTAAPDSLYPGRTIAVLLAASDDVAVTRMSIASPFGSQTITPNTKNATQSLTITVPITTPGGTPMTIDATVEDGYPTRAATTQSKTITIQTDRNAPAVTIDAPAANQQFNEGTGNTFTVTASAVDAEVGVKSVTVTVGNAAPVALTPSAGSQWQAIVPVPNVDGVDPVSIPVIVAAADYQNNIRTISTNILVKPLIDPNAPALSWTCATNGAMYPAGYAATLRVFAKGVVVSGTLNGVQKVEFFADGSTTPIAATAVSGAADQYEATYTVPTRDDGASITIKAVATAVSGAASDVLTHITVVATNVVAVTSNTTLDASNASAYDGKTVVVQSGTLTIGGAHSFDRLIVLSGASITHPSGGGTKLDITITRTTYIACGGTIDTTGRGYAAGQTYPGASAAKDGSGGSHVGVGGVWTQPAASTFGSIYRPQESGGGSGSNLGGGGIVRIVSNALQNDGTIRASGTAADSAGAGGSIWITANRVVGLGAIEANGGSGYLAGGAGGSIAIEYSDPTSTINSAAALGSGQGRARGGGAGTLYIKGPSSTYGDLTINGGGSSTQPTQLPSLGNGVAQSGTSGATLVTDRASDIPPYFAGHWVEISDSSGVLKGTWRVASVTAKSAVLTPNGSETINIAAGDKWQGVYRFDTLKAINGEPLRSDDPIRIGVNGLVPLTGPTTSGRYLSLNFPIVGTSVTVTGNVAAPTITTSDLTVKNGATLAPFAESLKIAATGNVTIESGGAIDASGHGFPGGQTYPGARASADGSGGSHIGVGGVWTQPPSTTFGSIDRPSESGGGGNSSGGGVVRINASLLQNGGAIRANGLENGNGGGGSGGSVWITATRINGSGAIEANGAAGYLGGGAGGAIAIEYSDASSFFTANAKGAALGVLGRNGGTGSLFVKRPATTYGDLSIVNDAVGQNTELPSLGNGVAQNGSSGATLVTDRSADIAPYFAGHWVSVSDSGGVLKGTWRIATISAKTVTLAANGGENINIVAGDQWRGVFQLDHLQMRNTHLVSQDRLLVASPIDTDASSTIAGNNISAPRLDATKISIQSSATGASVVGTAAAVSDPDTPVVLVATNTRSGATSTSTAGANGSFVVPVQGNSGDTITLKARDSNLFPMESATITVGTLSSDTPVATQLPKTVWTTDTNFKAQRLSLGGSVLAIANTANFSSPSTDKVVLLDVSDPARPSFIRTVPMSMNNLRDVKIAGDHAYVVGDRFATLDLTSTTSVAKLASTDPAGTEDAVAVAGGYAFTAEDWNSDGRVIVYDVSNPEAPRYLSEQSFGVAQNTIYTDLLPYGASYLIGISNGASGWDVTVIDRRNVNAMTRVGGLQIPNFTAWRGAIHGSLLYVVGVASAELVVVDLANPAQPAVAARLALPAPAGGIRVLEDTTLIAATTAGAVATTTDPLQLQLSGSATTGGNALDIAATGAYAYVANETGVVLVPIAVAPIIDASRITLSTSGTMLTATGAPRAITGQSAMTVQIRDAATTASISVPVQSDGSFTSSIPANGGDAITVTATDAQNRASGPVSIGTVPFGSSTKFLPLTLPADSNFRARNIKVLGNTAIVASYPANNTSSSSVVLFDISNPSAPVQTRVVSTVNNVRDIELSGNYAYIVGDRLVMLDISNPASALIFPNVDPAGTEDAIAVAGGYVFTAEDWNSDGRIHVYDVTNPAAPRYVSEQAPAVAQNTIYSDLIPYGTNYLIGISNGASGWDVTIIDRRDVNAMKRVGGLQIAAITAFRGRLIGTRLYVAGQDGGIASVDVSDPANPVLIGTVHTPGIAYGVDASGATTIVADRGVGVTFADNSAALRVIGTQSVAGDAWDVALAGSNLYVAAEVGLAVIQNVTAPPRITPSLITIGANGTIAGQAAAITGAAPIAVEVKNMATAVTASVTAAADGSFSAPLVASAGDAISVKATDTYGRVAGPIVIGTVPFGTATTTVPIVVNGDPNFRARAVKVEGTIGVVTSYPAYNTSSSNIVVFDLTNPAAPVQQRVVQAFNNLRDIELSGGWAYVVGDRFGTIDLRNPASTINLPSLDPAGTEDAIAVAGGYAFTAEDWNSDGRIHVYDVTNPAAPRYLNEQTPGVAQNTIYTDLIAYGTNYLIGISNGASGWDVTIIDRRDVGAMKRVGGLQIPQITAFRGRLSGTTLYVAGQEGGVAVVNVSDAKNPTLVSVLDTPGQAYGIEVSGTTVMTADRGVGVTFLDNTTTLRQTGSHAVGGDAWDVALGGTTLYVANEVGLALIRNVVAPPDIVPSLITTTSTGAIGGTARSVLGQAPVQVTITASGGATSAPVTADASGAFSATITARSGETLTLRATDALGRSSIKSIGTVPFFTIVNDQRGTRDDDNNYLTRRIAVDGTTIVTSNGTQYGTRPQNGSSKLTITTASQTMVDTNAGSINDIAGRSGFAYVAGDRFAVVDYSGATPVRYLTASSPAGHDYGVALAGNYAFTCEGEWNANGGLRIYDVTAPTAPVYVKTVSFSSSGSVDYRGLLISGTLMYATSNQASRDITIFDITTPTAPVKVSEFDVPNFAAYGAALDGTTLYLAGGDNGIAIVDVSTPATPVLRSVIRTNGIALGVAISGSHEIVVADSSAGLTFIDTTDPARPTLLGSQMLPGNATDVKVAAAKIYAATQTRFYVLNRP